MVQKMILHRKIVCLFLWMALLSPVAAHEVDIVKLVEKNRDGVVSVYGEVTSKNKSQKKQRRRINPFEDLFPFAPDLFERLQPQQPQQPQQPRNSVGSGFIIDSDGYILTNAHVIRGMDKIRVTTSDEEKYDAKIIGRDDKTDIALLKIESDTPLPTVKLGDSSILKVGQSVLAIGSPYGLDQTVTSGIISALGRRLPSENYVPFIQTDAAINPGNSGGPLINAEGKVIGINSQIISPVRAFAGVSFAIPINVAIDIGNRLRVDGVVHRGKLGIHFEPVTKTIMKAYGLDEKKGVLVNEVSEDTAAAEAGIISGDILLDFNGTPIIESADLPQIIGGTRPGTKVTIDVWRDGEILTLSTTLGAIENEIPPALLLGLKISDITEEILSRVGLSHGVVVTEIVIDKKTPRGIRSIRQNDIITHVLINQRRQKITNKDRFISLIQELENGAIAFYIWRNGRNLVVPIDLDRR